MASRSINRVGGAGNLSVRVLAVKPNQVITFEVGSGGARGAKGNDTIVDGICTSVGGSGAGTGGNGAKGGNGFGAAGGVNAVGSPGYVKFKYRKPEFTEKNTYLEVEMKE